MYERISWQIKQAGLAMQNTELFTPQAHPFMPDRVTQLDVTRQRWQVLYQQLRSGREPCYRTDQRLTCTEMACPWRASCVGMRAEWRR